MFIVVVTLGLLAAMGVYGLTAAQSDIRQAGHMREALQAQHAGEHALMMAAESLTPSSMPEVVKKMRDGTVRTKDCKTATAYAGKLDPVPPQAACWRLDEAQMKTLAPVSNPWSGVAGFASDSFGAVASTPQVAVEISNPLDTQAGAGYGGQNMYFTQVTATVFVNVRSTSNLSSPAQSVVAGRGRLTIGPIVGTGQNATY